MRIDKPFCEEEFTQIIILSHYHFSPRTTSEVCRLDNAQISDNRILVIFLKMSEVFDTVG